MPENERHKQNARGAKLQPRYFYAAHKVAKGRNDEHD
jgi:hypothetical protein